MGGVNVRRTPGQLQKVEIYSSEKCLALYGRKQNPEKELCVAIKSDVDCSMMDHTSFVTCGNEHGGQEMVGHFSSHKCSIEKDKTKNMAIFTKACTLRMWMLRNAM